MTNQERLWALVQIALEPGSQLDKNTTINCMMRAVSGDLTHIGKALIDRKRVLLNGSDIFNINLSSSAKYYSVEGE